MSLPQTCGSVAKGAPLFNESIRRISDSDATELQKMVAAFLDSAKPGAISLPRDQKKFMEARISEAWERETDAGLVIDFAASQGWIPTLDETKQLIKNYPPRLE